MKNPRKKKIIINNKEYDDDDFEGYNIDAIIHDLKDEWSEYDDDEEDNDSE